jgi:hypothetical protein
MIPVPIFQKISDYEPAPGRKLGAGFLFLINKF